jgi:hypothetical protein
MTRTERYSSSVSGKASLLAETMKIMQELAAEVPIEVVKEYVFDHNLLLKRTLATRKAAWEVIYTRYISERDPQELRFVARITASSLPERDRHLILFYELAKKLPLIYDLTADCLYDLYDGGRSSVSKADVLAWLDRVQVDGHDEIGQWSPQTRDKVASNYLTVARDFGLLEGTQRKAFARLYVPLPTFVYVLYRLKDEGQTTKAIISSDDFKLFLMDQRDVYMLLDEATRAGYVSFQRAGDVYDLAFHYGSLTEVVDELIRQVQ